MHLVPIGCTPSGTLLSSLQLFFFHISVQLIQQSCTQGNTERRKGRHNAPGVESLEEPKSPNSVASPFLNTVHLLQGGAKGVSCPELHLTSVRSCVYLTVFRTFRPRGSTSRFWRILGLRLHINHHNSAHKNNGGLSNLEAPMQNSFEAPARA